MKQLSILLLLALAAGMAVADGPETGVVSGMVTGADGAALPGVSVTITGDRGEKFTQTEGDGNYRFALLVPGSYQVSATLEGLGSAASDVVVTAGNRSAIDLRLAGEETSETITVTSESPLVDKFNVGAGATMSSEVGTEVTGENRTYYGVVNFMPGVTNEDENADLSSTRPNINGATWADATVYVDGVDTTFSRYGGSRVFLPSAATTEVSLESGGLSADYGRTVGSATNVIVKSGTNQFHGDFVYSATDESWNSEFQDHPELLERQTNPRPADFFRRTDLEKESNDSQFETGLGGPLKRDKAWFFISANQQDGNRTGKTINGDQVDESGMIESYIIKLNFQPGTSHQLSVNWIDTPVFRNFVLEPVFDRYAVTPHDISGELYSGAWNWSINNSLFMEAKIASQTSNENKLLAFGGIDIDAAIAEKQLDPRFPPGDPDTVGPDYAGNNYRPYLDGDGWHNGWLLDNGYGTNEYPREQFNLAFTQFVGSNHELKYGIDAQQVQWLGDVRRENLYSGAGNNRFDALAISGYSNEFSLNDFGVACDFNTGESCILQDYNHPALLADLGSNDTESQNIAIYLRDRMSLGDHWVLNAGIRAENQSHTNDIGREVMDSTDISPRLSIAYDINSDGRQLVTGYVGRSYHQLPQQAINEYLQDQFNGYNGYERRLFLDCAFVECTPFPGFHFPLPLGYSASLGFITPGGHWDLVDAGVFESDLEAYYKNEVILGYEWQFSRNWAFDAKLIWWEIENLIGSTTQLAEINGRLDIFVLSANHGDYASILNAVRDAASPINQGRLAQPSALDQYVEPYRDYQAAQIQLNRRLANDWALFSNITFSEAGGSSHGSVFNNTNDSYGENLEQVLTEVDIMNCHNRQTERTVPVDCRAAWTPFLGQPLSIINRDGRAGFDRTIIAKSTGWKVFDLTQQQHLTLGGHFTWQSGAPWTRFESAGGGNITPFDGIPDSTAVGVAVEERGGREISGHWWLNMSLAYGFPLSGSNRVRGEVRGEIQNVTDNQDQVGVTSSGEVRPIRRGFQRPRRYRVLASIKF